MGLCNILTPLKEEEEEERLDFFFWTPHVPHLPHSLPRHIALPYFPLWPVKVSVPLHFFFFFSQTHNPLSLVLISQPPPPFLPAKFTGKLHRRNEGSLISIIWGKTPNLLVDLYAFARHSLHLSFENDTHVIYELLGWYFCDYVCGILIWWTYLMSEFMVFRNGD